MLSEVVWQDFSKWKAKEQIDLFWMIGTDEFVIIPDQVVNGSSDTVLGTSSDQFSSVQ